MHNCKGHLLPYTFQEPPVKIQDFSKPFKNPKLEIYIFQEFKVFGATKWEWAPKSLLIFQN